MALIVAVWAVAFLGFSGVGALVGRLLGARTWNSAGWFANFWVGWCTAVVFLQLWNLWLPVNGWALGIVFVGGLFGATLAFREKNPVQRRQAPELFGLGVVWALLAGLSALEASGPITDGASGDYQLASVSWARAFALVRGLGNLFPRLAFNQSFILYEALLDTGPFSQNSYQLANGLLEIVLVGQCLWGLWHLLRGQGKVRFSELYFSLMLGPVLIQIADERFRSLSADPGLFFLGAALFGALIGFLCEAKEEDEPSEPALLRILLMGLVGVVCKLSFAGFAAATALVAGGVYWWENRHRAEGVGRFLVARGTAVAALVLVPWLARGILLSGYPVFPSTFAGLPVVWRVPAPLAQGELGWIQLRARSPNVPAAEVTPSRKWLGPWIKSLPNSVIRPLEFSACILLFLALAFRRSHWREMSGRRILLLTVPVVSLLVWFFAAPDPRFAGASFWILLIAVMLVALLVVFDLANPAQRSLAIGLCLIFFIWVSPFTSYQPPGRLRDFLVPTRTVRVPSYQTIQLASGDRVNVVSPLVGCWDIPLPCTDNYHPGLEMLTPGQMAGGFELVGSR